MSSPSLEVHPENKLELIQINHVSLSSNVVQDSEFYFGDGNLHVLVGKHMFFVHRYKIEEFSSIKTKIMLERCTDFVNLPGEPQDFKNTFKLLYCSLYGSSLEFDFEVLVSSLRIATAFDHPILRQFVIEKLESMVLPPIDLIPIAREFDITAWEANALDMLINRAEPPIAAEATILGAEVLVSLISQREAKLRQRSFRLPSPQEYLKMTLVERIQLEDQFRLMLNAVETHSEHMASDELGVTKRPTTRPRSRSRSIIDMAYSSSAPKRAKISRKASTIIILPKHRRKPSVTSIDTVGTCCGCTYLTLNERKQRS